jgi:amino acid transporter
MAAYRDWFRGYYWGRHLCVNRCSRSGVAAAEHSGPAVILSFIIAGLASAAALCHAEFAGLIPVAGSAYTYSYAVLGEGAAWLIGWDLLLEYTLVVAVVAICRIILGYRSMPVYRDVSRCYRYGSVPNDKGSSDY